MSAAPFSGQISIVHRLDVEITGAEDQELRRLLLACFPYETVLLTRRFIHEPPAQRWLVRAPSGELIAHLAAHDKIISVGGNPIRIGGIAEVCVANPFRGRGLVGGMLAPAHSWMQAQDIPFAMLFGQPKIYSSSGYNVIDNPMLVESGGLIKQWNPFKGKPMVRLISTLPWPPGLVNLRGPTF